MIKALTRDEYIEIEKLANACINAYSQNQVKKELQRLKFLSNYLPIDPYASNKLGEIHSWCLEASKRIEYVRKENAASSVRNAMSVLRGFVEKDDFVGSGGWVNAKG